MSNEERKMFSTPLGDLEYMETIMWYDGPLQFIGKINDETYMVYLSERENTHEKWMFIWMTEKRLQDVLTNQITLRDMFTKAEKGFIYEFTYPYSEQVKESLVEIACDKIPDEELPDQGIYQSKEELNS